jgi:hypothetical protein
LITLTIVWNRVSCTGGFDKSGWFTSFPHNTNDVAISQSGIGVDVIAIRVCGAGVDVRELKTIGETAGDGALTGAGRAVDGDNYDAMWGQLLRITLRGVGCGWGNGDRNQGQI